MQTFDILFSPIRIGGITLPNRIVLPPMVCFGWGGPEGFAEDRHVAHYRARAAGGVGLVIVEAACVLPEGRLHIPQLGLWSDGHIPGLARIAAACRAEGARTLLQVHHAGRHSVPDPANPEEPVLGPSDWSHGRRRARAASAEELAAIGEAFVAAARRAFDAGFDGVELHGAHGYLLNQVASPIANRRTDGYGGDTRGRTRLLREIVAGIRSGTSPDFLVGCRMGGLDPDLDEGVRIARAYAEAGVQVLHVSGGIAGPDGLPPVPDDAIQGARAAGGRFSDEPFSLPVFAARRIRKEAGVPVIAANGIHTGERAAWLVREGWADMAAIGRPLLHDPDWARRVRQGQPGDCCLHCRSCGWFRKADNCPDRDRPDRCDPPVGREIGTGGGGGAGGGSGA